MSTMKTPSRSWRFLFWHAAYALFGWPRGSRRARRLAYHVLDAARADRAWDALYDQARARAAWERLQRAAEL